MINEHWRAATRCATSCDWCVIEFTTAWFGNCSYERFNDLLCWQVDWHWTVQELFFYNCFLLGRFGLLFLYMTAEDVGPFGRSSRRSLRRMLSVLIALVIDRFIRPCCIIQRAKRWSFLTRFTLQALKGLLNWFWSDLFAIFVKDLLVSCFRLLEEHNILNLWAIKDILIILFPLLSLIWEVVSLLFAGLRWILLHLLLCLCWEHGHHSDLILWDETDYLWS